jgi:predicted nucleotidyltransferase
MGGSGTGGFIKDKNIKGMQREIRESEEKTTNEDFEAEVSAKINKLLANYNNRDTNAIKSHIDTIVKAIQKEIDGTCNIVFGGSYKRDTYVDGLSDIDSLVLLNNSELINKTPNEVLKYFSDMLKVRFPESNIEIGKIAITIHFADGNIIQLLPAVKSGDEFKISNSNGDKWSKINPRNFTNKLTETNKKNSNKIIPTIKIVKAINSYLPKSKQLTGYHIESLVIEAFKAYSGEKNIKKMLQHFFESAKNLVKSPIKDKSGQSVYVDEYLGRKNSIDRRQISIVLDRISKRMKNANSSASVEQWMEILG